MIKHKRNGVFCRKSSGSTGRHEAATFLRVRSWAHILGGMDLLTQLNAGDMMAQGLDTTETVLQA